VTKPEPNAGSAGAAPPVESTRVVALYEPTTGQIRHLHSVTVLVGGEPVGEAEAISAAKDLAAKHHGDVEDLAVATSDDRRHLMPHRVDPSSGEFVPIDSPRRSSST
jgi:hypothetical protein